MPPALHHSFALWLLCVAGTAAAADPMTLPSGDSSAIRERMSGGPPPPEPVAAPLRQAPTQSTRLPRLSSGFGTRIDPINGSHRVHAGLDMPGHPGTPILAAAPGIISFAGRAGGYGQMVEVDHGGGLKTRYAHLSHILVRRGDAVSLQQTIALMGSTGRSTGNHLHFEVRVNGRATNPLGWFGGAAASQPVAPYAPAPHTPAAPAGPHISDFARRRASTETQ